MRVIQQRLFQFQPGSPDLAKTGGYNHRCAYTVFATGLDYPRYRRCRRGDHRQVDGLADAVEIRIRLMPLDLVVFRVDRVDLTSETTLDHVFENQRTHRTLAVTGTKYGNRLWLKQLVKIVLIHV